MFDVVDNDSERIFFIKDDELKSLHILEEKIADFVKKDVRDVVIDMRELSQFDSLALASFIRIKRKLNAIDRPFRIINYNDVVFRVIELAGLEDFLLA